MNFNNSLKLVARQIIELSSQLGERVHTWNDEESAPIGGYIDRAGYIVFDDIELFVDVYAPEDEKDCLLRARLAWSPKKSSDQDTFTIVTLDFVVVYEMAKTIIADSKSLDQQALIALLNNPSTKPAHIHVSLESGKNTGKRYEYSAEDLSDIKDADKAEFMDTLNKAYRYIASKI